VSGRRRRDGLIAGLAVALLLAACGPDPKRMNLAAVNLGGAGYPAAKVAPAARSAAPVLHYVTDRAARSEGGYGAARDRAMAYGTVEVRFGAQDWPALVAASSAVPAAGSGVALAVGKLQERARFPATPLPFAGAATGYALMDRVAADQRRAEEAMRASLTEALARSAGREIVLFVHGYNTAFDEAAAAAVDIWHAAGRPGVPLLYSWPSGAGGPLGYLHDRESVDFSVFHFKQTLRLLAAMPEVARIHLVAHSLGTSLSTTALRELQIAERAAGRDPRASLKVETLILAAPDISYDVVSQRLMAERFGLGFGQITAYLNRGDGALALAQRLMRGDRFGRLRPDRLTDEERAVLARAGNVHFVVVEGLRGGLGHSYHRTDPRVLSDIAVTIRSGAGPGAPARRLTREQGNFWTIPRR